MVSACFGAVRVSSCAVLLSALVAASLSVACCAEWSGVEDLLRAAVAKGVTPGAVAAACDANSCAFTYAVGNLTYGEVPPHSTANFPMTEDTLFDMASCTKVLMTTTSAAQFYQRGELDLDMLLIDERLFGQRYNNEGKQFIKVRNLLLHNAGFPPDPSPNYWDPKFGCASAKVHNPPEDFSCREQIFQSVMAQPLVNPVGAVYVYSDLSMITMMFIVGKLAAEHGYVSPADFHPLCDDGRSSQEALWQCYYEAYARKYVIAASGMTNSGFLPPPNLWGQAAPTWNDSSYRHQVMQGTVSDGNAYALGGISGHAGFFSNVQDVIRIARLYVNPGAESPFLNATTVALFRAVYNVSQSSRALGWDTNNYQAQPASERSCGSLSGETFLHLGFTGTQVCIDPVRQMFTILLTNRVYPDEGNIQIRDLRPSFNNLVQQLWDRK
eukprot:ANDGO_02099.mRNA.1 UPF0214 protein YfeW